jgi:hypothetical protein
MATDLTAANYRRLAEDCLRDAKAARFPDVRQAYEKLAAEWNKLADESEHYYSGRAG